MKVLTLNLWGKCGPFEKRWRYACEGLKPLEADVLCLQEAADAALLQELARFTDRKIVRADTGSTGLAVLSNLPVADSGIVDYRIRTPREPYLRKFIWTEFRSQNGQWLVANTHFSWMREDDQTRQEQARELRDFVLSKRFPAVLCGDFNSGYDTHCLALLRESFRDTMAGFPDDKKFTWDNRNPFTQLQRHQFVDRRIDLILASEDFLRKYPLKKSRLALDQPDADGMHASDHFGVLAEFGDENSGPRSFYRPLNPRRRRSRH